MAALLSRANSEHTNLSERFALHLDKLYWSTLQIPRSGDSGWGPRAVMARVHLLRYACTKIEKLYDYET